MLPPPEPGTLAWYLAQFQADSLSQGRTAGTIYAYGSKMKPLLALGLAPHEITTDHLRPLLTGKPATRGTMRGMMRAFLQYLVTQGVIETNPAERLPRITVEPPNRKPLSADEVKALYAAALARDERAGHRAPTYRLIVLLLLQGLRRKEVVGIRWSDVHWDEGRIDVPETKGRRAHPAIPLGPDLRLALEEEPRSKPSDRLIRSSRLVYYRIKMLAADTGIERLHPHLLRHTWASTWLMEGGSPLALQQLGGWNSPIMIERYTRTVQAQAALDRGHEMNISGRMLSRNQETEIPAGLLDADDDLAAALADPKTRAMLSAFVQALKGGHDATA
jgi:integrase